MEAFFNKSELKQKYLDRVITHQKADTLIQGITWENGKGCAIGCTLENYNHAQYEVELGIPEWLARLEDRIFEGLDKKDAQKWPVQFLEAIPLGADLEKIKAPFMIFILELTLDEFDHKKYPKILEKVQNVINLYKDPKILEKVQNVINLYKDPNSTKEQFKAAAFAAFAAFAAASTASTAFAASFAAAFAAASTAAYDARKNVYKKFADKLLELMKECK